MVWMGRVSYSTYLFHWIVMHQLLPLLPNTPLTVAALIVAAFGVGGLVHVLGERPLLDFRRTSMSWVSAAAMSGRVRSQIPT
jgi:peptidoglycan/LPS O-acetylase OafA/YrhL